MLTKMVDGPINASADIVYVVPEYMHIFNFMREFNKQGVLSFIRYEHQGCELTLEPIQFGSPSAYKLALGEALLLLISEVTIH